MAMRKFANCWSISGNLEDKNAPVTIQLDSRKNIKEANPQFSTCYTFRDAQDVTNLIMALSKYLPQPIIQGDFKEE